MPSGWKKLQLRAFEARRRRRPGLAAYRQSLTHYCEVFDLLVAADFCTRRRRRVAPDDYCRAACRVSGPRPATAAEIAAHWRRVERLAAAGGKP